MIKYLVFGDLHYDYATKRDERIDEILARAKRENVDFILSIGDVTAPFPEYDHVIERFRTCGIPFYPVLGNHDVKVELGETMAFLHLEKPFYSFTQGSVKFILLNSNYERQGEEEYSFPGRKGENVVTPIIPSFEMEWLKRELEDDDKAYVIFSHHSLINEFRERGIRNRKEVHALFEGKRVLLCMNGHDHGEAFKIWDHVPYYTLNSAFGPWIGVPNDDPEVKAKYAYLHGYVPYDRALSVVVTIDGADDNAPATEPQADNAAEDPKITVRIDGIQAGYEAVTPAELGLVKPTWNGVSVEPKTSSYVIRFEDGTTALQQGEMDVKKDALAWEPVKTEHLVRDKWIDFRREEYRMPDGTTFSPFYNYSKRDYAVILARDVEGKYLCVKQYRHGIHKVTTEFVAGGLEYAGSKEENAGDLEHAASKEKNAGGNELPRKLLPGMPGIVYEDALDAAKRELIEETGYASGEWEELVTLPSHATLSDDYVHVFIAKNCHKVSDQGLDDTEFLNVVLLSEEELEALIDAGDFEQCVHVMAWYMAKAKGKI